MRDLVSPETPIDLTNCDREPIHIPGAVQPHGVLLALDETSMTVRMASESAHEHLGMSPAELIGREAGDVIGAQGVAELRALAATPAARMFVRTSLVHAAGESRRYDATVHRSDGLLLVELEPALDEADMSPDQMRAAMQSSVERLERSESLGDLANDVAEEMRRITGFDRVWVYRFHPDWHGEIIGEAKRDDIETWHGMHYPASDIPAQARALFLRNWLRVIPDLHFTPSPLVPQLNPVTGEPLDLGRSVLRSVSPIHVQYLTNMRVTASLVISLVHRGKLWGLISGHHYSGPKRVPHGTRTLCEFMAQALSLQVGVADRLTERDYALLVRERQAKLVERLAASSSLEATLVDPEVRFDALVSAEGAALLRDDVIVRVGVTPSDQEIRDLAAWVATHKGDFVESSALPREYPPAERYAAVASGLLAVMLSPHRTDQLMWFRSEQRQTVRWAGDPRKPVEVDETGTTRLTPRGSFELWEEEARGTSRPWVAVEREAALDLRRAVLDVLIKRAEELETLNYALRMSNAQLEESAVELELQATELLDQRTEREDLLDRERTARSDAEMANRAKADFLAVMSHELRTPLNAIGGYAEIIALGIRGPVSKELLADLRRIQVNQRHLLGVIDSILNFSKLEKGAIEFTLTDLPVAPLLNGLDALIGPQMRSKHLDFRVEGCEPHLVVRADEEKLRQVMLNLLTNALKFTAEGGLVAMSCHGNGAQVQIVVRDTGRGIPANQLRNIFDPFVQVDRSSTPAIDQGVGLGLAISRELARGMGGDLTAESRPDHGSTFTVTLPASATR